MLQAARAEIAYLKKRNEMFENGNSNILVNSIDNAVSLSTYEDGANDTSNNNNISQISASSDVTAPDESIVVDTEVSISRQVSDDSLMEDGNESCDGNETPKPDFSLRIIELEEALDEARRRFVQYVK
jgi:hypothetical protein